MAASFNQVIAYFEKIASEHLEIQHTPSEKHFFRTEYEEVLGGINRTDVKYPLLILEGFSCDFTDQNSDNILKNRKGAFLLVEHVPDVTDYDTIQQAWNKLELIGDEILRRMKKDKISRKEPAIRDFNFDSVQVNLFAADPSNDYGIRYTYTISSPLGIETNAALWLSPTENN